MDRGRFTRLVEEAIESLPDDFKSRIDNVAVVVEDLPSASEVRRSERDGLLLMGLYEGQPLTLRDSRYGMVFPDKITIFQSNVEAVCNSDREIREEVRRTVLHEIAHHFGIDDERLDDLGY